MATYSKDFKRNLVKKALLQPSKSPRKFAKEVGVSSSALYNWIKQYQKTNPGGGNNLDKCSDNWTIEERFNILVEASSLTEEQQGTYCRRKGIYKHQLSQWKEEFMQQKTESGKIKSSTELKTLRTENKALKKDLHRKNKALAETAALLVLKKKAALLFGEPEED